MTCYTRHLTNVLKELHMEDTKENRRILDNQIREVLCRENDGCPVVWKDVKVHIHDPMKRELLIEELRKQNSL
ncbi:MAG: hypothetical protein O8C66_04970 [Candidatus Methanoperedens sp.]|nr:hypothetical protein [Candidatus Methanoperedens sp.]MCZ7369841.1 hypothetical protein [Candidatus Methanoperedens sp.]